MKLYFDVIILVLVVVIFLLFFVLFKIYKLHEKSTDETDLAEQQELLSSISGSKDSSLLSSDPTFSSIVHSFETLSDVQGKQEIDVNTVQPDIKDLPITENGYLKVHDEYPSPQQVSLKKRHEIKILLQYDKQRSILKLIVMHLDSKTKSKMNSSETYVDVQVSPYRFRTYRNPGYRRPVRAVIKKSIEFRLDRLELKTTYLLIFLLRYDPFSRLKVDGEVTFKISEVLTEGFIEGCQVELGKEFVQSKQEFTAFIFRPK